MDDDENINLLKVNNCQFKNRLVQNIAHNCYFNSFHNLMKSDKIPEGPLQTDIGLSLSKLNVNLPFPITSPNIAKIVDDPGLDLVNKKQNYIRKLSRCKRIYKTDKRWLNTELLKGRSAKLPRYFLELTAGVIKDPDRYFDSDYDFYYTGGTMAKADVGRHKVLVHPTSLHKICFTNVDNPDLSLSMDFNSDPVHNIGAYADNITVRQKFDLSLYRIRISEDYCKLKKKLLWHVQNKRVPFIDFKVFPMDEISCLDLKHHLNIYDYSTGEEVSTHSFESNNPTDLAQFDYVNLNTIAFIGGLNIQLLDTRSMTTKADHIERIFFTCDTLKTISVNESDKNYVYLTSKHEIMKYDFRQMKVVRKWNHFLSPSPLVTKLSNIENGSLLFMSTINDTVCLQLVEGENYLPFKLHSKQDTLRECNIRRRFCYNQNLKRRLDLCVLGMELTNNINGSCSVYTSNSIGDLFCHKIGTQPCEDELALEKFSIWVDKLPTNVDPLKVTHIQEMRTKTDIISMNINDKLKYLHSDNSSKVDELINSFQDSAKYKLFDIWNDYKVDVQNVVPVQEKVSDWLNHTL